MGAIFEFGVQRNVRVVNSHIKATAHVMLGRLWSLFGADYHKGSAMSVYRVPMVPNFGDMTFRYCLYGTYGKYLSDYLDALEGDFAFVDIGANQGLYSLIAARNPHCRRIVAVEPVRLTFALLEANIALNQASARSALIRAALSDRAGEAQISVKRNHSGVAALPRRENANGRSNQPIRLIDIAALDEHIPADLPLYVKIDVEGHEGVVIAELLKSAHAPRIRAIFHEMDERWADAGEIREMLLEAGFTRFTKFGIRRHYDVLAERG